MTAPRPITVVLVVTAVVACLVSAFLFIGRSSARSAVEVRFPETSAASATPADGQMKVYVTGAVARPGVYPVRPGDRVADVIEAAGGPAEGADTLAVNFARRLRDEDQVNVPRVGEPVGPVNGSATRRTNINVAPARALEELPGIGAARAQKIVESRTKDGPFNEPGDLVKRKIVPQSVLDGIRELIDVRS
ncbi:MAG: ComEA family DNA-binding protein [Chloroflexi bacterium]|nr:ComEA family DNA-binding protein [Chloroflexota bacterium]